MSAGALCVSCRKQAATMRWRPFCSERCKLADLGRWLSGDYRVPGPPSPTADDIPDNDLDSSSS